MTKYVLNSGGLKNQPERSKKYLAEIVKGLGDKPNILVCLFAQPREDWETKFQQYYDGFFKMMPDGVKADFSLAAPDTFEDQVAISDIIYFHGGDDHLLKYWMSKFDIPRLWEGKVVAGSSAGSDFLCKSHWSCDWRQCLDGLGILPVKFLPHFNSDFGNDDPIRGPIDWEKAKKELEDYKDKSLPVYALEEGEFVIIEK
jgi:peptidase E